MRKRIQKSMMLILAVTLVLFYAIISIILYNRNLELLKNVVRQEAEYIRTAVNISGTDYLEQMSEVDARTRLTLVDQSGNVLYDSSGGENDMENHSAREEVQEAFDAGTGEAVRMSDTLGRELYYYAVSLSDGSVLRVAKSMDNLAFTALNILPIMGALAVIMIVFALLLAKWQTARLIRPINELDLVYAPPVAPVYDPILIAASQAMKKVGRQVKHESVV